MEPKLKAFVQEARWLQRAGGIFEKSSLTRPVGCRFSVSGFRRIADPRRVQRDWQPKLHPGRDRIDRRRSFNDEFFTISADRDPAQPMACFKIDGDVRFERLSSSASIRSPERPGMIRQQTPHQDAAAGGEEHNHAQCSAAVFAPDASLMLCRLRSDAAGEPESPASMDPYKPFHAIQFRRELDAIHP